MKEHGFVEGTSGVTYVHKKDDRRHRRRCAHYHKDGSCAYMSKCGGAAHCDFYSEEVDEIPIPHRDKSPETIQYSDLKSTRLSNVAGVQSTVQKFSGIQNIRLDDIVVPDKFLEHTPDPKKVKEIYNYYKEHKKLDKPIYVSIRDGKYYLEDKYLRYYVAKELGKTWINACMGTRNESTNRDKLKKVGTTVQHKKFGKGTITESDNKYVTVSFSNGKNVKFSLEVCLENNIFQL